VTSHESLQLAGGICEGVGLLIAAFGISETRQAFTNRPSVFVRLVRALIDPVLRLSRRIKRRFSRRRTTQLQGQSIGGSLSVSDGIQVKTTLGFSGSIDDRVSRLQEIAQQHEDQLRQLHDDLGKEKAERDKTKKEVLDSVKLTEDKLEKAISRAAAGGLALETWGVLLFFIGVVLNTWGALVSP
jgi:enterochelin esterase-like enzyme